jgi:hypothetical protein
MDTGHIARNNAPLTLYSRVYTLDPIYSLTTVCNATQGSSFFLANTNTLFVQVHLAQTLWFGLVSPGLFLRLI